ncbi:hypothetical protein [Methylosinus sp. PW1]|uniref:hypothetical protein n=1 Tax=Methylosinus sp. PW1 TaxID=107636 RepID=UPI0012EB726A|nr:hypothetical protein [Methylosinus sp. PW1]
MRRFSLRGLLAAVALALQALSAAYALGASPATAHGRGDAAYCAAIDGTADRRGPVGGHRDAGACISCQSCLAGFSPFLLFSVSGHALDRRSVAEADWTFGARIGLGFSLPQAQRARAPPGIS